MCKFISLILLSFMFLACDNTIDVNKNSSQANSKKIDENFQKAKEYLLTLNPEIAKKAVPELILSAKNGNVEALHELATYYQYGKGGVVDYEKAENYYQQAIDKGYLMSIHNLGMAYMFGQMGKKIDYQKAYSYFKKAEQENFAMSINSLGILYSEGFGVDKNKKLAVLYFQRAADLGDAPAMFNLALAYDLGQGIQHDLTKAFQWYLKSAQLGHALIPNNSTCSKYQNMLHLAYRIDK